MMYDSITFSLRFCMHLRTSLSFILFKPLKKTKKIFEAKQQEDITSNHILRGGSIENLDGFLKTKEKIVKKKRRSANPFQQKLNIDKQNYKIVVSNNFGNLGKKELPTLLLALTFEKNVKDNAIIDANAYFLAC